VKSNFWSFKLTLHRTTPLSVLHMVTFEGVYCVGCKTQAVHQLNLKAILGKGKKEDLV